MRGSVNDLHWGGETLATDRERMVALAEYANALNELLACYPVYPPNASRDVLDGLAQARQRCHDSGALALMDRVREDRT